MAALRTSLVKRSHAYTSADIPWFMDVDDADAEDVMRHGRWRLFHYLSGGGMSAFGRPSGRELQLRRQNRFLWIAATLAAVWVVFSII
jgi:hypothetical protein